MEGLKPLPNIGATKKINVLTLYIEQPGNRVILEGMVGNKTLCFNVLGEAIKTVANFDPAKANAIQIVSPGVAGRMISGVRNMFNKFRRH